MYKSDMFTVAINLVGLPGISVPIMRDSNHNMPIGLQLVTNSFNEETLFNCATGLERVINYK